jgi:hypothetical protein
MARFTTDYCGRTVEGVRLDSFDELTPYLPALNDIEISAVQDALGAGCKVEVLDDPVAEIHVDDLHVICGFPNPTRNDAPEAHGGRAEELEPEDVAFSDEELRALGLDPEKYVVGCGGRLIAPTRWSFFDSPQGCATWSRYLKEAGA